MELILLYYILRKLLGQTEAQIEVSYEAGLKLTLAWGCPMPMLQKMIK
jgi:hypothetical protein